MGFIGGVFALAAFAVAIYFISLAVKSGETTTWIFAGAFLLIAIVIIAKSGARA